MVIASHNRRANKGKRTFDGRMASWFIQSQCRCNSAYRAWKKSMG